MDDLDSYGPKDANVFLIGNKSDLIDERRTNFNEAYNFANKHNMQYIEVSAKTGNNIFLLFENLTRTMIKKEQELEKKRKNKGKIDKSHVTANKTITIDNDYKEKSQKKDKCC